MIIVAEVSIMPRVLEASVVADQIVGACSIWNKLTFKTLDRLTPKIQPLAANGIGIEDLTANVSLERLPGEVLLQSPGLRLAFPSPTSDLRRPVRSREAAEGANRSLAVVAHRAAIGTIMVDHMNGLLTPELDTRDPRHETILGAVLVVRSVGRTHVLGDVRHVTLGELARVVAWRHRHSTASKGLGNPSADGHSTRTSSLMTSQNSCQKQSKNKPAYQT